MSKKQSDAVKARIETVPALATKTFKTVVTHGTTAPYCVIHGAAGEDSQERLAGPASTMHPRYTLHIVGTTADQVEVITDLVKAKFILNGYGIPLAVAGETCSGLWWSVPGPPVAQSDPQPAIVYQVVELGWTADPA